MRSKSVIMTGLLLLALLISPAAAIFGPPTQVFKGRVNFIQATNFTLITNDNQIVRILVDAEKTRIPSEVQLGVEVEVRAVQGEDQRWYLEEFEKINLTPQPAES